jgi:hypothetical protein
MDSRLKNLLINLLGAVIALILWNALVLGIAEISGSWLTDGMIESALVYGSATISLFLLFYTFHLFRYALSLFLSKSLGKDNISSTEAIGFIIGKFWYIILILILLLIIIF